MDLPSLHQRTTQGNIPHPLGLTNPDHVATYACMNERMVMATHYYDEQLLRYLEMLDNIWWLFARGRMGHFIEIKERIYRDLTLEFLSTLPVEVTRGPQFQAGYISFYLQGQLYDLNLGTFNSIFAFPLIMDLRN